MNHCCALGVIFIGWPLLGRFTTVSCFCYLCIIVPTVVQWSYDLFQIEGSQEHCFSCVPEFPWIEAWCCHDPGSHQLCFGMRFPICRILSTVSCVTVRLSAAHFTPSPMTLLSLWTEAFFMFWPIVASPYDVFSRAEKDFCSSCVRRQCDEVVIESSPGPPQCGRY